MDISILAAAAVLFGQVALFTYLSMSDRGKKASE
jgi:hypothetical protein